MKPNKQKEIQKHPFLAAVGLRVREIRSRRGMTRKQLADAAQISERHLASLENGVGNASLLLLLQVTGALKCSLDELIGDPHTTTPEWLLIRELLHNCDEPALKSIRLQIGEMLGKGGSGHNRASRIAMIGLRGAGKSSLGVRLADQMDVPFVELSREIENFAGCTIGEIQALYGANAYRRYEQRALEESIQIYPEAVIATPGGLVSDAGTFNLLLSHCTTVWLKADPEDHMNRVTAQGDMRPIAASHEAMSDLRRILDGRESFYSKADHVVDTSRQTFEETLVILESLARSLEG